MQYLGCPLRVYASADVDATRGIRKRKHNLVVIDHVRRGCVVESDVCHVRNLHFLPTDYHHVALAKDHNDARHLVATRGIGYNQGVGFYVVGGRKVLMTR